MAVDERKRHQSYTKAIEIFGEAEAEILIAHLPPGGYPNLATKQDMILVKQDIATLRQDMQRDIRDAERRVKLFTLWTIITVNLVTSGIFAGIAFTAAGLGG